jgi:hypothetical protein
MAGEPKKAVKHEHAEHEHGPGCDHDHPEPTPFLMLVGGLAGQAHVGLGLRSDPITNKAAKDLPTARQAIDLLAMLEEKTKGNLSAEESHLLGAVLADLRLAFVRASKV